jgi:hypothetical protein
LNPGRFAAPNAAALDTDILHLLPKEHAVNPNVMEHDAFAIKNAHRMAAMFTDGHAADFDLRRTIRPFADVKHTDSLTSQHSDLLDSVADEPQPVLTVNRHVFLILAGLNADGVATLGVIDRLLNRGILAAAVTRHNNGAWFTRHWRRFGILPPHRDHAITQHHHDERQ